MKEKKALKKKKILFILMISIVIVIIASVVVIMKLDASSKYVITTDMKLLTMRDDGGTHYNIYYEIDLQKSTVKKCEDYYEGLDGYVYKGKEDRKSVV